MALKLMYITNRPEVAKIAEVAGVDRIFVDMEYIGKDERQAGLDTVKSHHTINDVRRVKDAVSKAEVLVRINPIHEQNDELLGSEKEIDGVINAGADIVMLPMFKSLDEVNKFIGFVAGRAKTMLLVETPEAMDLIEQIVELKGIDSIHIGLNDLHLALHKKFMFELLADGTVERMCSLFASRNILYGFGGIARLGYGTLPAEFIIAEHYRLGSSQAILSRSFCNANIIDDPLEIEQVFIDGVKAIRAWEEEVATFSIEQFEFNRDVVIEKVQSIVG